MPVGIIVNSLSIALGGVLGAMAGHKLKEELKGSLELVFGLCSMGMGISSIILMENMPAVIFAVILGTAVGVSIHLGAAINRGGVCMQRAISKVIKNETSGLPEEESVSMLVTIIVLFCASGTGIYGSMVSGMSGDHTILISKSILDLFTAAVFACHLGMVVALVAVPQFLIFLLLFLGAVLIYPLTTPAMVNDFKACGGLLMVATGFRMIKLKMFPTADMIPAMIFAMPVSYLWTTYIMPLLA